ncbi:hypothetical protein KDN24_13395 [Bacillus sp. Bva_UNVM-123]|uniref:hypothetical protein n=1 Tax=Bacillus sp. Bva_UNVM-123 TaxID=2829798 RepID=UPI00391F0085
MRNHTKAVLLFLFAVLMLSACSASLKEEQNAALETARETFKKEPKETNNKNQDIKFYLPFGFEVKEETPNNIILKNGAKTYILFYNQHEGSTSKVVYEATLKQDDYEINETFTKEGYLGYLLINNTDKNINELTVGVGGVKITTQAKTKGLSTEVAAMMEIVNSIKMMEE